MLQLINNLPPLFTYIAGGWIVMTVIGLTLIQIPGMFQDVPDDAEI